MSVFASRRSAQLHVVRASASGTCAVDMGTSCVEVAQPVSLQCPVCDAAAATLVQLQRHLRSHAPPPRYLELNPVRVHGSDMRGAAP
eukprot:7031405-Lingulodinium_polyedra.AAC.1